MVIMVALVIELLLDMHNELGILSCVMQKRNLMFIGMRPLLEGTIAKISSLESTDGESFTLIKSELRKKGKTNEVVYCEEKLAYYSKMDEEFQIARQDFVKRMTKNITDRFQNLMI